MQNIIKSIQEELDAMLSGHFIPYYKVAIGLAAIVALIFSIVLSHGSVFEGKIAVIDLDGSNYSTELISKINTSSYIEVSEVIRSPVNPITLVSHDRNLGVLYIPKGLEKSLKKGDQTVRLGYFSDDTNEAQNAKVLQNLNEYIPELGAELSVGKVSSLGFGREGTEATLSPMQLKSRNLFNPASSSTISTIIYFVYFFSSLTYGLTSLMIIGRLKITGMWNTVLERGFVALLARTIPYALFYTTGLTLITAVLVLFGQLRFDGNYFVFVPSIFMTGLAFGWLGFLLSWKTNNPGEGASKMIFLVPPGFIMGGSTMAVGIMPIWAYYVSHAFPLVWLFRFFRDIAMRGRSPIDMMSTYGMFIIYLTVIAFVVMIVFNQVKKPAAQPELN
ncbi:multidrug ABC transporter permease [Gilliamella apicola]|uniref:Multidrug ABC transporter permease n=2 Tax=Gilliamella apicola TaxID=1196095 RepID=A0A242NJJ5_9GAMM|nr:multidrug ABC transporter permease [Gilliamella apicola]OTP86437.1 multidrug ABC transporter permease [Gilliamella apicola]OTQ00561.1 multidrug ABC transporter permease [Gilliamella apicola]OTQ10957.1 multidrug ABC transporter permease [Gilliamella apicola]OTQ18462.1 multidrug ABC transporter permease [Gilliamella apicola]